MSVDQRDIEAVLKAVDVVLSHFRVDTPEYDLGLEALDALDRLTAGAWVAGEEVRA